MANKQALRDLQTRLAERVQAARNDVPVRSWLAVECGTLGLLFPLPDAGEIHAVAPLLPVPHSHRWFLGVTNLRGHLNGVVDLAAFLGIKTGAGGREQARLVGFNPVLDINCVLLVDRLAGLRSATDLTPEAEAAEARPHFAGGTYRDAAARVWQELDLAALATDESFLRIVAERAAIEPNEPRAYEAI